jgi:hypothetical protein
MKRLFSTAVIFFLVSLFFFSCYYDNEEDLYPAMCDTTNVTFTTSLDTASNVTIESILEKNCYSCHSNINSPASTNGKIIRLEDYADVVSWAPQISQAINHTGPSSIVPMPYNAGKINSCSITQFDHWYLNGMPRN